MNSVSQQSAGNSTNALAKCANRRTWWLKVAAGAMVLLCLGHAWLTLRLFPSWSSLTDNQPIISVDHAIHLYHGYLGAQFLRGHATSWGYDPYFMAGYPKTPVYDSSSAPAELFQLIAGAAYSPRAYKVGITILIVLVPFVFILTGWGYGVSAPTTVAGVTWAVLYWWVGYSDTLVRTGLVAFVWASALAVLAPALLVRWVRAPNWRSWLALCGTAAWGIQSHSTFPIIVFAPLAVGYAAAALGRFDVRVSGGNRMRWHAATWGALAIALALTIFWWWPLLKFLPLKSASDLFMIYQGNPHHSVARRIGSLLLSYYLFNDATVPLLLVLFGCTGLARWCACGRTAEAIVCGVQIILLSALTFAGSEWWATRNLEPLRFQVPLALVWCVPAGEGVVAVFAALRPRQLFRSRRGTIGGIAAVAFLVCAIAPTFPALWWTSVGFDPAKRPPPSWQFSSIRIQSFRPLAVGLRPEMDELVDWIVNHTDRSARILFEDQLRLLENQDPAAPESLHWTPLLPLLTNREYVGGLYHLAFIPHRYAAFGDWNLAGRPIHRWSSEELRDFLDQYNIGWVITWSRSSPYKQGADRFMPLSTDRFASLDNCELVARIRRHTTRSDEAEYAIFRVNRPPSYFAAGHGQVLRADFNQIELRDLEPERGELVLRYHWLDQLRSDPPLVLERAEAPGDPVGFIRIRTDKPVDRLSLINRY